MANKTQHKRRSLSPFVMGDFWLDRRPDGKSAAWQIAWYDRTAKCVRYASTRCETLDAAKVALEAHYAAAKAKGQQDASAAVLPQLLLYWEEHGQHVVSPDQIASSLRAFIGFLMQDAATPGVTYAECNPALFRRFTKWRMGPHAYSVDWAGRCYTHKHAGISGNAVNRNLQDIAAALNYAVKEGRVPYAPHVPPVEARLRPKKPVTVLSPDQLAAVIGYALDDPTLLRFVLAQIATLTRPEAVRAWQPWQQADLALGIIDTHPPGWQRTKKRNPLLPIPTWYRPWLKEWIASGETLPTQTRKRWATMRAALGLPADTQPKIIRRTMATWLNAAGVPEFEVKTMLGHTAGGATDQYIQVRPDHLRAARTTQDEIWLRLMFAVRSWRTNHRRTTNRFGKVIVLDAVQAITHNSQGINVVGGEGLEPPTLSV
jgi:integrase